MLDYQTSQMLMLALIAITVSVGLWALVTWLMAGDENKDRRIKGVAESRSGRQARRNQLEQAATRRQAVADVLKEIEANQQAKEKVTLRLRLQRAGLDISVRSYWIASCAAGLLSGVLLFMLMPSVPIFVLPAVAFVGTFGLPQWMLTRLINRRQSKFTNEFANSIDVIVRGVKSGLPLNECLAIIGRESPSPVREEFQEVVEQQRVGVPLGECFDRMISRMPLPEVKFFSIVISIQQQAGGNLSEALGNLAGVLRDRKALAAKVQALSAEAKASAMVLGSLPFVVAGMVYFTTPSYIALLWQTNTGIFVVMCGGIWMTIGILVMKKMINFKY